MWYQNIGSRFFVLSQSMPVSHRHTDRQTDRITTPETALALLCLAVKMSNITSICDEYHVTWTVNSPYSGTNIKPYLTYTQLNLN